MEIKGIVLVRIYQHVELQVSMYYEYDVYRLSRKWNCDQAVTLGKAQQAQTWDSCVKIVMLLSIYAIYMFKKFIVV